MQVDIRCEGGCGKSLHFPGYCGDCMSTVGKIEFAPRSDPSPYDPSAIKKQRVKRMKKFGSQTAKSCDNDRITESSELSEDEDKPLMTIIRVHVADTPEQYTQSCKHCGEILVDYRYKVEHLPDDHPNRKRWRTDQWCTAGGSYEMEYQVCGTDLTKCGNEPPTCISLSVTKLRNVIHKHYPMVAGRAMQLADAGEDRAYARWNKVAQDFHDALRDTDDT